MADSLSPPPPSSLEGVTFNPLPTNETCAIRVNVHSPALWDLPHSSDFLRHPLPRLHLQLALIFSVTQCLHILLRRFHLPRFTSELLAGIILGKTVLGQIPGFGPALFPPDSYTYLETLSKLGYIFFIFLSGVKMNPRMVFTSGASNMTAWTVGTIAPLIPFAGGLSLAKFWKTRIVPFQLRVIKEVVAVQNIFSFPVIFSLLNDLKIMNSELGRLALTSSLISDLVSNTLQSVAANISMGYAGWNDRIGVFNLLLMVMAVAVIVIPSQPLSKLIIKHTQEGKQIEKVYVIVLSAAVMLSALLTDNTGLLYHHGPFILGLALPDGPPLGSTLVLKLETLVCGFFAPLIVTIGGLRVDFVQFYDLRFVSYVMYTIVVCLAMKYAAILFPALASRMPVKDAFALAFIMSTQGIVQMSFYSVNSLTQSINLEVFQLATFSILLISSGMQYSAHLLYDHTRIYAGYQKRDIQHIAYNGELRVLVSSIRADDAFAVKKILEASFPNRENPLAVYALTLVELVGRAHPLLIDHQLGQKSSTVVGPHVQKILEVYQFFREQYMGMVSVQMFTAMSLPKFMHDDICSLAFDKMISMIILPFHIKWNVQGNMVSDNGSVRAMNCNVLDMAPCSVGILVDRHRIKASSSSSTTQSSSMYNVAIIFIGGNDDREALAYGKRMARSPGVHLTVVRFVPWDPASQNQWDAVVDAEMLKEMRLHSSHQENIVYREEEVKDGAETALIIHSMEEGFDLIVVGRRHREDSPQLMGLDEWNDLPELGSIGDMLASGEIKKPLSVLVVQQQILRIK